MSDAGSQVEKFTKRQWAQVLADHTEPGADPLIRRQNERFFMVASAKVTEMQLGKLCMDTEHLCALLDVSESGMMVRTRTELRADTRLAIEIYLGDEQYDLTGTVVHCTSSIGAYKVGIHFDFAQDDEPA